MEGSNHEPIAKQSSAGFVVFFFTADTGHIPGLDGGY